jgi:two-component system, cell cycle sensor histidine kinase and response regulator CckA
MTQRNVKTEAPASLTEQRYHYLADMCQDVIVCLARDFTILSLNPAFETLTGWTRSEWLGKSILHLVHDHDRMVMTESLTHATAGEKSSACEVRFITKFGDCVSVELSLTPEQVDGCVASLFGIARDRAKPKHSEETLMQSDAQLQQAHKMEAIGRLAGGIAHDFNNLLTIITGYSQLLLVRLREEDQLRGDVEEIRKAAVRAASLTQQLLAFSRSQVMVPRVLNLNAIVETVDSMLQRLIGEHIHLVAVLEPMLGHVRADPGQMEQVIVNLAVNARDAMPKGGKLTIETSNVEVASQHTLIGPMLPGRHVKLSVSDTGCGMDRETQTRIFEPFFTTKGQGKGTGLGLATVYGIVKQSAGHITVESELGQGTAFHLYLPRVSGPIEIGELDTSGGVLPYGTETVLLVEDEPAVRVLIRDTLRFFGYTVLEARHGFEAQLIGSQHTDRIDLLMTDVVMPQMSGRELADGLMRTHHDVRVLYMSGYTEHAMIDQGILNSGSCFLQKPFTPELLARKVRAILDM